MMTKEQILSEVDRLAASGEEEAIRQFLVDHFTELPKDVQGKVFAAFFTDAVERASKDLDPVSALQNEGLEALRKIDEIRAELKKT